MKNDRNIFQNVIKYTNYKVILLSYSLLRKVLNFLQILFLSNLMSENKMFKKKYFYIFLLLYYVFQVFFIFFHFCFVCSENS